MADPKVKIKRSAVAGKIPTPDQLPLGEIALNTYDKKLFASANVGLGTTVFAVNPWTVGVGTNTYNTYFTSGNVGIGTSNPQYPLEVAYSGTDSLISGIFLGGGIISRANGSLKLAAGASGGSPTGNSILLGNLDGIVLDGGSAFTSGIELKGGGGHVKVTQGNLLVGSSSTTGTASQPLQVTGGGYVSGNLGIGSTRPTSKLSVVGDAIVSGVVTATGGFNLGISSAGTVITNGPLTRLNFIGAGNTFRTSGTTVDISIPVLRPTISDTPPVSASPGDLWWESDTGVLKIYYDDGSSQQWVDANGVNEAAIFSRSTSTFTATGGQTTFNVTYTVDYLDVFVNGVLLTSTEYTANNGSTVVLTEGATQGDIVICIAYGSSGSVYWNKNLNQDIYTLSNVGVGTSTPRFDLEVGPVGAATTSLWVNGDARVTGILSVGQGTITLNGNTDRVGIGTTNITEALHVVGNIYSSGTVTGSGSVIQVGFATDPGSSTTSTSLVNAQGALFNFTPKRSNSTIYQIWTWQIFTSTVASTNTAISYAIAEGNTNTRLVSSVYQSYSIEASDGNGMGSTASVQVSIASTGTSTRSFSVFHRSLNSSSVFSNNIRCTFIEVAP
jgi:hypothetical protein